MLYWHSTPVPCPTVIHDNMNDISQSYSYGRLGNKKNFGRKIQLLLKSSPYIPLGAVILVIVVIAIVSLTVINQKSTGTLGVTTANDQRAVVNQPVATQTLNKTFAFPLKDQTGKEVSKLVYSVESVELRNEIIIKGQKATALKGKRFLVINLKITNNYNKTIQINARDYLRLIVDGSPEKLAPDIHNDPVEVQAISTKYTRVGMAVSDTAKSIILQVGEITGKKELIKLSFK